MGTAISTQYLIIFFIESKILFMNLFLINYLIIKKAHMEWAFLIR